MYVYIDLFFLFFFTKVLLTCALLKKKCLLRCQLRCAFSSQFWGLRCSSQPKQLEKHYIQKNRAHAQNHKHINTDLKHMISYGERGTFRGTPKSVAASAASAAQLCHLTRDFPAADVPPLVSLEELKWFTYRNLPFLWFLKNIPNCIMFCRMLTDVYPEKCFIPALNAKFWFSFILNKCRMF